MTCNNRNDDAVRCASARWHATLPRMEISLAATGDAQAIRDVHCETWAVTYAMLVPAVFFEHRLQAHRRRDWQELLVALTA